MDTSTRLTRLLEQAEALQACYPDDRDYQFYMRFAIAALTGALYCAKVSESRGERL